MLLRHGIGISPRKVFLLMDTCRAECDSGAVLFPAIEMSRSPGTMIGSGPTFTFCTFITASDGAEKTINNFYILTKQLFFCNFHYA